MAYTRFQRSLNARKQLRDRKGRWIKMGGGIRFRFGGQDRRGTVQGFDGDYVIVDSKNPRTGQTERLKRHRSEIETDGSKASISQAQSRVRARREDDTPAEGLHNDDSSAERRLNQLGIKSDDAQNISRADSREEAERAWSSSEGGQEADRRYAELKEKDALSSSEKSFKTRYENAKNSIAERYQNNPNEIYEDGLGNYSIPKDRIESKTLSDLSEGDRILGKGERNSPEITKSGERDKSNGEVLEVAEKSTDDSGNTTLKVRDEDGNEREYKYNKRAGDAAQFAPADSLYDAPAGEESDADLSPDDMPDISSWETIDPNDRGDGPIRMRDPESGDEFFVKIPDDNMQALNDALASRLYDEAGIRSATQEPVKLGDSGRLGTASPAIPDGKEDLRERIEAGDKEYLDDLREGYAVDAWLGNTNPGGEYNENIMSDTNGQPVRVSQSGALLFDGDDNERALKNSVTEWTSMRRKGSPSEDLYKGMTPEQMRESARRVASISDEDIDRIVDGVGLPENTATPLKETLKKRREDIKKRAGIDSESPAEKATRQKGSEEQRPTERSDQESDEPREEDISGEEVPADEPILDDEEGGVGPQTLIDTQNARRGDTRTDSSGEEYTKTSANDEGSWEDSQGNEYTDEEVAALTRDSGRSDAPADEQEGASEGLSESQRAQVAKIADRPVGSNVTDEDGDSYTKNDEGDWVRDDNEEVIGSDEDLARYIEDRSLSVDENNPSNQTYNPNVVDNRDYRPVDDDGIARDRTPEEQQALQAAKAAQVGDTFTDDDGDEYVKGENDKWSRTDDDPEESGYHNSEHFIANVGPWNPRPTDSEDDSSSEEPELSEETFRDLVSPLGKINEGDTVYEKSSGKEYRVDEISPSVGRGEKWTLTDTSTGRQKTSSDSSKFANERQERARRVIQSTTPLKPGEDSLPTPDRVRETSDGTRYSEYDSPFLVETPDGQRHLVSGVTETPGSPAEIDTITIGKNGRALGTKKNMDRDSERSIVESTRSETDSNTPEAQSPEEDTDIPEPLDAPTISGESTGRITDPADLDSRPEGSRIQIAQNNKTRIAEKGEDGKWRDDETGRVIAKPVSKNSNVTDLPGDVPEVNQNIGGDRDSIADGLRSLPSGSRVDIRNDRSESTKSSRKNDDGSWTDEDGNTRSADEIADGTPEDVFVDRIGSSPSQDRAESGDREIPGQGDLFDQPQVTETERETDGQRTDSDLPGDSDRGSDSGGRGDDSGDGPLGYKSTGKAPAHGRESAIQEEGGSTPDLYEVDPEDAEKFRDAISKLKDTKYGAAAYVYDTDEYKNMRMFMNESGTAGYALNGDEIVSVFSLPENPDKGVGRHLIASAVGQGGTRLDAFDTVLPKLYAKEGFKPVARTKWNDDFAPEGWDKNTFKDYNEGEPDVVFMRFDPDSVGKSYDKSEGDYVDSYDQGVSAARGDSSRESMSTDDLDDIKMDKILDEEYVNELTEQLKNIGLGENDYIIVEDSNSGPFMTDGHHLLEAAKRAGISDVPVKRFANTEEGRSAARRELIRLEALKEDGSSRLREYEKPEPKDLISDILNAKPGDSFAGGEGEFFTKDDDGRWYDVAGESLSDGQLAVRLRGKDYEKINTQPSQSDDNDSADSRDTDAPVAPSEEPTEEPSKEIPENVQKELDEAIEAFDPDDEETQENIAALDAMPRGTQISYEGFSFTKAVKYWKQDNYPEDAPKTKNRYTSADVLLNVDVDSALVTQPEPPKSRKPAPSVPDAPTPIQVDEFGNEFIDNGSGKPHFKGDTVNVDGRSPMVGVIDSFSPDGKTVKIRDNKDGRLKIKKTSALSQIKDDEDAPDLRGEDSARAANLPEGTKMQSDDMTANGEYLEKRWDGVWEHKNSEGVVGREMTDEDLNEADWNFYDKKAADDRRERDRKEREREEREENRLRKKEEAEEAKRRRAEEREEEKIMRDLEREEKKKRAQEDKDFAALVREEEQKEREAAAKRDRDARDERIEAERAERAERRAELLALKRDIIERDREARKKERDEEKERRDKELEEKRKEREEQKRLDRERRERERARREREREERRRREEDEDDKKRRRRNRRDMDGNGLDNFPGGFPFGGLPLPGLPEGKKGRAPGGGSGGGRTPRTRRGRTPRGPAGTGPNAPVSPSSPEGTSDGIATPGIPTGGRGSDSDLRPVGLGERSGDSTQSRTGFDGFDAGTGTGDSSRDASESVANDRALSAIGTQLNTPAQLDAVETGTMIARTGEYSSPLRKTQDGTWVSAVTGADISSDDLSGDGDGAWDVVGPSVAGVLLDDDQAFAEAPAGVVVVPTENSPASEMDVADFQKQPDGTWSPRDAVGQVIPGMENVQADQAPLVIGPAIVDSAPQTGIVYGADDSGVMRLLGQARERIDQVSAPLDTPESEHMKWTHGTAVTAVGDFVNAVEGTVLQDTSDPNIYYRKNSDGSWSFSAADGTPTSTDRVSSSDLADGPLEFRVSSPSTAAGMEFPIRPISDRGELNYLPTLSAISAGNLAEGAGYYTKHPDGNWRFVPPVGSSQEAGAVFTPEEFARIIANQEMIAYPSSSIPTVPQVGARPISSRDLDALPRGTVLTDGSRVSGEGRTFVKSSDGTWALHNRSGVEQATGFTSRDIEGLSRIAGVVQEEFAGPFSADDAPVGVRALVQDGSGISRPYVKTASGHWARLDTNGNPVWPSISQEDLFDSVDSASVIEFSRPRRGVGDPVNMQDIHTAPVGTRIGITSPEGVATDLVKTGVEEWSTTRSGSPMTERAIARALSDDGASANLVGYGNGEPDNALESEFDTSRPDTLRGADNSFVTPGAFVESPDTGVLGMVETVNPESGQAIVRDVETGEASSARISGLYGLSRNPARDFAQVDGEDVRPSAQDIEVQAPTPDTASSYYGQPKPSTPELRSFDGPLVPSDWTDAVKASFEAIPANSGRRFEDSPFAPALAALSTRGITESPFITEGGRRLQPGSTAPTDAFGMISGAGLSSDSDASAARAAFVANKAALDEIEAENAARMAEHSEEVAAWGAANGVEQVEFTAETFKLKGIGGQTTSYMIGTDYWMDSTFVSIDDLDENQQISLKYVFGGQEVNSEVVDEIRSATQASLQDGYTGFSNETQGIIDGLDGAISRSSFLFDTRVIMTGKMRDFVDAEGSNMGDSRDVSSLVGSTITNYGYSTVSVDVYPQDQRSVSDVLMFVRVPAGYNGAWVGGKNADYGIPNAREVLLPRGTKMFIHRVSGSDGQMREIYAEIVPLDWMPMASRPESTLTGDTE